MSEILIKVKYCSKCKTERPIEEFSKDMSKKDGLRSVCKLHEKQYRRENQDQISEYRKQYYQENKKYVKQYRRENKDKISEYRKQYYQENKDKIKEKDKQRYQENKDKILERNKKYMLENKDKLREYRKQYDQENKYRISERKKQYRRENQDQISEYRKQYYQENKKYFKQYYQENKKYFKQYYQENKDKINQYRINRKKSDINVKIKITIKNRIRTAIKKKSGIKSQSTINLIGCTVQELRDYLESQFTPEMNWSNFGTYWHIDHIIACAKFNLTDPAEQKKCFNWRNLRPCPAVENLSKSDKLDMGLVKSYNIDDLLPIKGAEN